MGQGPASPRRTPRRPLAVESLEERAVLSTVVAPGGAAYINALYTDILGRNPTAAETTADLATLRKGLLGQNQVVQKLITSKEYRDGTVVSEYEQFLHRQPTSAEIAQGEVTLSHPKGSRGLEANLLAGREYYQTRGGGTNAGFINAVFVDAVHRQADAAGLATYEKLLKKGSTRTGVVYDILNGDEAYGVLADQIVARFLYRPDESNNQAVLVNDLRNDSSPERLIGLETQSLEFINNNQNITSDLVTTLANQGNFGTLTQLLNTSGLAQTLEGPGLFTIQAPTDAAFARLPAGELAFLESPAGSPTLVKLLDYHVISGQYSAPQLAFLGQTQTLEGSVVQVTEQNGNFLANQANIVNLTGALTPSIKATNGIINPVDTVLIPPA